jgi:hypothetical protein
MIWKIENNIGRTVTKLGDLTFDATKPNQGLIFSDPNIAGSSFMRLGMSAGRNGFPLENDSYCRDADFVSVYKEIPERPIRYQAYWRMLDQIPPEVGVMWELIISAQTPLLDCDPTVIVQSRLNDALHIEHDDCRCVMQHATGTYFELTHPSDDRDTTIAWNDKKINADLKSIAANQTGSAEVYHNLFQRSLEKGVILRSRLRGGWLSPNANPKVINELFDQFAKSEPVLTT